MKRTLSALPGATALATVALIACTSPAPQRSGEWIDPALGANSALMRGAKVLVACEAWDLSMRQNCQDLLAFQLRSRGADPVVARFENASATGRELDARLMADAGSAGARTVMIVALTPAVMGGGFSGASIGIGGFSWGGSGGAGIGLSAPIGGTGWGSTGFAAQARITDAPNGRLLWTTSFVASPSSDIGGQVRELTGAVVDAAQGAGLL